MDYWFALITSLPTQNATARMRVWRTLKTCGAAVLRDGVYLLPEREACRRTLDAVAAEVQTSGGSALVLRVEEPAASHFPQLFDRSADYAALLAELNPIRDALAPESAHEALKAVRKLRKAFVHLVEIDFFPAQAQRQADAALSAVELRCARWLSPGEPQAQSAPVLRLRLADYQGRRWATRQRPWVDRLACAWLIRRFIDAQADILWLTDPALCPADALGFDFDGARFSHTQDQVSFEVLLASFALERPGLTRLGLLVHSLDVGGVRPAEAAGVESVLAGLREALPDDDVLLAAASAVFDGLLTHFERGTTQP